MVWNQFGGFIVLDADPDPHHWINVCPWLVVGCIGKRPAMRLRTFFLSLAKINHSKLYIYGFYKTVRKILVIIIRQRWNISDRDFLPAKSGPGSHLNTYNIHINVNIYCVLWCKIRLDSDLGENPRDS